VSRPLLTETCVEETFYNKSQRAANKTSILLVKHSNKKISFTMIPAYKEE